MFGQRFQQQGQRQRRNRTFALQRERCDAIGMPRDGERIARRRLGQGGEAHRDAAAGEQRSGRDIARGEQSGTRIERGKPLEQNIGRLGDVGLAQQQRVGERRLAAGFRMAIERRLTVQRINERDDAVDDVMLSDVGIGHQCMQDRGRIGQARRLDQHPVIRDLAGLASALQIEQRGHEVTAHRAAQAAGGQRQQGLVAAGDQFVIQADLAEFVDDDRGAREGRVAQDAPDQRGLATAEKASDDGDRDHGVRRRWTVCMTKSC